MRLSNVAWNLGGLGAPLLVAALAIPPLIRLVGTERFGLLAIAWSLIGFAGVFDLGIGRATTQSLARLRGKDRLEETRSVVETATALCFATGVGGALLLSIAVLAGAHTHIKYANDLSNEVTVAAFLVAVAIPVQAMSAMFRGVNEAFENFRGINLVRMGLGAATFLGPLCVALFTTNLAALVSTILISRVFALVQFRRLAQTCIPRHSGGIGIRPQEASRAVAKQLLTFGGWITVSGVVYPLMMQADRLLIGSLISAEAVATYAIPNEITTQSLIVIGAITTALFPRIAAMIDVEPQRAVQQFYRWLLAATALMLLVAGTLAVALPYLLPLWLGNSLPPESVVVGQILTIGLVPYTIGTMYVVLIHARNRSDITAKTHLLQAPLFLALLYWLTKDYGLAGTAWAWVARVAIESFVLMAWSSVTGTKHGQR